MSVDIAGSIADSWYRLGFQSATDLANANWIAQSELYQWADDAANRLSRLSSLFLTYDNSVAVESEIPEYQLPGSHVFTVTAWFTSGNFVQQLRLTTVGQLFALDAAWASAAPNVPQRISLDAPQVGYCVLYPPPSVAGELNQVLEEYPTAPQAGSSVLPLPFPLQGYFTDALIAGARGKESDSGMPEVAAHLKERMNLYEAVIDSLWGPGQ